MADRVFEWFRVISTTPSEELLAARTKSAQTVTAAIMADKSNAMVVEMVALAAYGPRGDTALTGALIEAIKENQNAFPRELDECALEIRVFCGYLLDGILASPEAGLRVKKFAAATFLDTALSLRESTTQEYYEKELAHLYETAKDVLADIAIKNRQRAAPNFAFLNSAIKAEEPVTVALLEKLRSATLSTINHLVLQSKLDQEEINILWWLTSGFANLADNKISKLDSGAAAYCCGIELADLSAGPPSTSLFKILNRALELDRDAATAKEMALRELINSWTAPLDLQILTREVKQLQFTEQYPMLLPLAWLSRKLHNTGSAKSWEEEFNSVTGVSATKLITPMGLGHQLIKERMALRLA